MDGCLACLQDNHPMKAPPEDVQMNCNVGKNNSLDFFEHTQPSVFQIFINSIYW